MFVCLFVCLFVCVRVVCLCVCVIGWLVDWLLTNVCVSLRACLCVRDRCVWVWCQCGWLATC